MCVWSINEPIELKPGVVNFFEQDFQYSFVFTRKDIDIFIDMLASGKVGFPSMVTGVFSMENVVDEYISSNRKGHIKGLIDPSL